MRETTYRFALALALAGLLAGAALPGCTDDLVEPDCDTQLQLVLHGSVDGADVELESPVVSGRWLEERFYVTLEDPTTPGGYWVLEIGYNPLIDDLELGNSPGLDNQMLEHPGGQFVVTSRPPSDSVDPAERYCHPERGELCAGLGVYEPGSFNPETDVAGALPYDAAYHPVRSGTLTLETLDALSLKLSFDLELGLDESNPRLSVGSLQGCMRAGRDRVAQGELLR